MKLNDIAQQIKVADHFDNFDLQIEVCKFIYSLLSSEYQLDGFSADRGVIYYDLGDRYYQWDITPIQTRLPKASFISGYKFVGSSSVKEHPKQWLWKAVDPSNIWVVLK